MVVSQFISVCELTHRAASPLPQLNLCNGPQTPNWWGEIWGDDKRIETLKKETCTSSTTFPLHCQGHYIHEHTIRAFVVL